MATSTFSTWLMAARPRTLPAAAAPVALGSALAAQAGRFEPAAAALCLAFALLTQIGANFANDYFDHQKGADAPGRVGPTRAVAAGLIAPAAMWRATLAALGLAFLAGCGLIIYGGWGLLAVGIASLLAAVAYTGGPYPLGYHGLGDLGVFIFFGLVAVVGTVYVQAGWPPPAGTWTVAAGCGLLAANILVVNNVRDAATDARAGKRTLVVRLGRTFALWQYATSVIFATLTPAALFWQGYRWPVLGAMATFPLGHWLLWKLGTLAEGDGPGFNRLLGQTAMLLALWVGLLSAGLVLAKP
jgi:1,4-dihydroxy-2-naphthoate octaprenyltransferase